VIGRSCPCGHDETCPQWEPVRLWTRILAWLRERPEPAPPVVLKKPPAPPWPPPGEDDDITLVRGVPPARPYTQGRVRGGPPW